MTRIPLLSLCLTAASCLLMLLPPELHALLYFDRQQLAAGHPLGLVTGHWIHADWQHLAWNAAALLILAGAIERHSRRLLVASIAAGTLAVDALLLSPFCELVRYCGLSGLLNTLLGVALYLLWRETRSPVVPLVGAAALAKIALELQSGQSVFTDISWPPFAAAHLAGMTGAALLLGYLRVALPHSARGI